MNYDCCKVKKRKLQKKKKHLYGYFHNKIKNMHLYIFKKKFHADIRLLGFFLDFVKTCPDCLLNGCFDFVN